MRISNLPAEFRLNMCSAGLALWEFNKRRIQFGQYLNSNTTLTHGRYFRLVALAMTEMFCTTPLGLFVLILNASGGVGKWVSWSDTHFDYGRIEQIPGVLWRSNHRFYVLMELTRWLPAFSGLVFFCFFGFAQEARKQYIKAYIFLTKYLKFLPKPKSALSSKLSS